MEGMVFVAVIEISEGRVVDCDFDGWNLIRPRAFSVGLVAALATWVFLRTDLMDMRVLIDFGLVMVLVVGIHPNW